MKHSATEVHSDPAYREALDFLYSYVDYEQSLVWNYDADHFNLDRVSRLLEALGNPHRQGWFIHVAGTNGKGSVAAMISSALIRSGYRTGLYTSPHLVSFRERIRLNGTLISKQALVEHVNHLKECERFCCGLTFFEVWTALAFDYFAQSKSDVSVIEVGMGGRLDSTNVIIPAVSVITSISMDHKGRLGDTLNKIAHEKAGIIKHGIPVVSAPQCDEVLSVIEDKARSEAAKLIIVGRDVHFEGTGSMITYQGIDWEIARVNIPLAGGFQYENAATALAVLETLAFNGYAVYPECAREGIEHASWPGRLQTLSHKPEVIVDGACNTGAMEAVRDYLLEKKILGPVIAVFGICSDKEVQEVIGILEPVVTSFMFTQIKNPRAVEAGRLASMYEGEREVFVEGEPSEALSKAVILAGADGLVIVTGSLYLVGEVLKLYTYPLETLG